MSASFPLALSSVTGLGLLLACSRPPAPAPNFVDPDPGERHLRDIRQLTFGGNNAEAISRPTASG